MKSRKERRLAPRISSRVPLDIYDSRDRMIIGEGRFVNVSVTGVMLETRMALRPRQTVRLHAPSNKKPALDVSGRVVWRRKKTARYVYGIQFNPRTIKTRTNFPSRKSRAGASGKKRPL